MAKKRERETIPRAAENLKTLELSCVVGGTAKWNRRFRKQLSCFLKVKHILILSRNLLQSIYTNQNLHTHKKLYTCVWKHYLSMPINRTSSVNGKQTVSYPHNEILFSIKKQ